MVSNVQPACKKALANKLNDRASVATGWVDARETREGGRLSHRQSLWISPVMIG